MKYTNKIFDAPANSPRNFIGELEDEQAKKEDNNVGYIPTESDESMDFYKKDKENSEDDMDGQMDKANFKESNKKEIVVDNE